ncbi:hypothetical protein XM38_043990 [Halomicronema hongdechloris C2206]|uniref:DUF4058 domain-containing protein n=1 Tax=Halomicronema hongdechloris C2206 TaxID=1641165 RepID=A0A1Z3HT58_9CYAN|nr:DUF4058 family protein [Halomicronema hongdechloris]ASC73432.1 hypothetical protein XM38_043990 [Halomicronema hongdechloris C2206]
MPSPCPGMNPYLEHPDRWSTVHNRLIVALADALTPQLLPKYQVDIEKRVYEIIGANSLLVGRPDVSVQRPRRPAPEQPGNVIVSQPAGEPVKVIVPMSEEVREAYLEVKEVATQAVITAIEILSPSNKQGEGRQKYEQKRQQVLSSRTHLVEIDLLRGGNPLPTLGMDVPSHYRILVSRADQRPMADLYAFDLPDPIPVFTLPLQAEDEEPTVSLQALLTDIYGRSGYDYFIDYTTEPLPPLSQEFATWMDGLLREKGLRSA